MKIWLRIFSFVFIFSCYFYQNEASTTLMQAHDCEPYVFGNPFQFECKNSSGVWSNPPICVETKQPLSLTFGRDEFFNCGIEIKTVEDYNFFKGILSNEKHWNCRVKIVSDHADYIPFSLPLWGVVEADHLHISSHMNIIFHAFEGRIIGVSAYQLNDRFQFINQGTVLMLHGPIKWFSGNSFKDLLSISTPKEPISTLPSYTTLLIASIVLTFFITFSSYALYWEYTLKPNLIRTLVKDN